MLCRWAFCRSLAETTPPSPVAIPTDSNVEMTWQVFGGASGDLLIVALKQRCHNDHVEMGKDTVAEQFRLHLHRGIGYLAVDLNIKDIKDFIKITAADLSAP
ncbi:DNA sulfur modification protein DndE [Leptolyngbya sp. Cla-17]|uniref:DNA sulfur modification protein DndE n=1 Tax=Leptolyngbya sp. Cla-17 TaxID=2803751 RepID=UPI001FDA5B53|nr:DNA sulfur modification protein DndE [Leptolyngbya sp. Cla-17]